jgi:GNAT superfamily N-acetyltransferase
MQRLAQEVWGFDPSLAQETVGDLAWMTRQREAEGKRRLWLDGDHVLAWAWVKPPGARLFWEIDLRRPELYEEVLDWFEAAAEERPLETIVRDGNSPARAVLEARGFAHDPAAPWLRLNSRDLAGLEEPVVPDGYRLTTMAETPELAARVELHRLVWHPSRVTEESYRRVTAQWPYRPELDCIVVASDGTFASYALGWIDEANETVLLEPVGTHPDHRRQGLAAASSLHALRQGRAAGAGTGLVRSRGDPAYPAPTLLYESIGFSELNRDLIYVKP